MTVKFHVKDISWSAYDQKSPIVLQDKNGPCPLIALVNTLILNDDIHARTVGLQDPEELEEPGLLATPVPQEGSSASFENIEKHSSPIDVSSLRRLLNSKTGSAVEKDQILSCLGDILLSTPDIDSETIGSLLESLPLLHTGLDVNPNLTTGSFDPSETASQIFSAFRLNFVHGWCREPGSRQENVGFGEVAKIDALFDKYPTFEAMQEFLLTAPDQQVEKAQIEAWLDANATQLSSYGLESINARMKSESLAIFFRNNHFSTLYKAQDQDLYLLITDDAFAKKPAYVWQSINSVSGSEDLYFSGDFTPMFEGMEGRDVDPHTDENLLLAQQLQEKEDSRYAKMLQEKYESRSSGPNGSGGGSNNSQSRGGESGDVPATSTNTNTSSAGVGSRRSSPKRGGEGKKKIKEACIVM